MDSEAGYRENTATVLECNMLSESVQERLFWFVFQGAGLTDAVCVRLQEVALGFCWTKSSLPPLNLCRLTRGR